MPQSALELLKSVARQDLYDFHKVYLQMQPADPVKKVVQSVLCGLRLLLLQYLVCFRFGWGVLGLLFPLIVCNITVSLSSLSGCHPDGCGVGRALFECGQDGIIFYQVSPRGRQAPPKCHISMSVCLFDCSTGQDWGMGCCPNHMWFHNTHAERQLSFRKVCALSCPPSA